MRDIVSRSWFYLFSLCLIIGSQQSHAAQAKSSVGIRIVPRLSVSTRIPGTSGGMKESLGLRFTPGAKNPISITANVSNTRRRVRRRSKKIVLAL